MREARAQRRRDFAMLIALPLLYLLILPHASQQGLAAGLLAPAGLERTSAAVIAVLFLQLRLITVWLVPAAVVGMTTAARHTTVAPRANGDVHGAQRDTSEDHAGQSKGRTVEGGVSG